MASRVRATCRPTTAAWAKAPTAVRPGWCTRHRPASAILTTSCRSDEKIWLTIAQRNDGKNGIWKTTTAGRVDGKIDPAAWKKVDTHEHAHGSFQHYLDPKSGVLYVPGFNGVRRTKDKGDTWDWAEQNSGYTSSVIGTENYLYSNYRDGPKLLRATRSDGSDWAKYADEPEGMRGAPPYGNAASFDGQHWILVLGGHRSGLWRYVEP